MATDQQKLGEITADIRNVKESIVRVETNCQTHSDKLIEVLQAQHTLITQMQLMKEENVLDRKKILDMVTDISARTDETEKDILCLHQFKAKWVNRIIGAQVAIATAFTGAYAVIKHYSPFSQ